MLTEEREHYWNLAEAMVGRRFNGSVEMAGLGSGSFGLSNNVRQNKSYVHVKLTDSAFRAIEDYLRIKVSRAQVRRTMRDKGEKESNLE